MNGLERDHVLQALEQNVRFDGRKLTEYRQVKIEYGVSNTAEGSAKVTIGNTVVIAGVKLGLEKPYSDTPTKGNLMVGVELLPLSSSKFESGPPSMDAIELARVVDRTIRESQAVDVESLCVTPGEKVWSVMCDLCTINDDGNLFDACSIAALAALKNTKFPVVKEDGGVDYKTKTDKSLTLSKFPIAITVWKIGDQLLVDPLVGEQDVYDARLTIGTLEDGTVCAFQKGGEGTLLAQDVKDMMDLAFEQASYVRKQIKGD